MGDLPLPLLAAFVVTVAFLCVRALIVSRRRPAPPTRMQIAFEIVEGEVVVAADEIVLTSTTETKKVTSRHDPERTFEVTGTFARPTSPFAIACPEYQVTMAMGVHTSKDWESVTLADVATLRFRCTKLA